MNQKEFKKHIKHTAKEVAKLVGAKSEDYASKQDPYKAFVASREVLGIDVDKVILSRMLDKISRLSSLKHSKENYESVQDSAKDLIGYALILEAWYCDESKILELLDRAVKNLESRDGPCCFENVTHT